METSRVLNLLNTKAGSELKSGLLEESRETATQAINYYLSTYSAAKREQTQYGHAMLQCQAQVSALTTRKIGVRYQELGEQRQDEGLVKTGKNMIYLSSQILKISRNIEEPRTTAVAGNVPHPIIQSRKFVAKR